MKALAVPLVVALPLLVLAAALGGGAGLLAAPPAEPAAAEGTGASPLAFSEPVTIDCYRAGGEPVIAVTPTGALVVAAHPAYTHFRPTTPEADVGASPPCSSRLGADKLLAPTQAQAYMWRSIDGGETWTPVSVAHAAAEVAGVAVPGLPNEGPRGANVGVSDPDFTLDANGRMWYVEIPSFVGPGPGVAWSDDGGLTWLTSRPHAVPGMDRPWIASLNGTLYLVGNGPTVYASEDGIVFREAGARPPACNGDLVSDPLSGRIYLPCGNGRMEVSANGGGSWTPSHHGLASTAAAIAEPAVDAAGNVYVAGTGDGERERSPLLVALTRDGGATWDRLDRDLRSFFPEIANGSAKWAWTSAGSEGRLAVSFLGSPVPPGRGAEWHVYSVVVTNATGTPEYHAARITDEPVHRGGFCNNPTCPTNYLGGNENLDRRMGEFFETTIDRDGVLHVVFPNSQLHERDWVSHAQYARLVSGPSLVVGDVPDGFPRQG